jgi:hypothetical protein
VTAGQTCWSLDVRGVCAADSFCDDGGVCVLRMAAGASCNDDDRCQSGNCSTAGVCSAQSGAEALALFAFCTTL